MDSSLVDLFPQAAGSPSIDPPPCALFEDFFTPASTLQQPIYLNWFVHVQAALADVDSGLPCIWLSELFLLALTFVAVCGSW